MGSENLSALENLALRQRMICSVVSFAMHSSGSKGLGPRNLRLHGQVRKSSCPQTPELRRPPTVLARDEG